MQGLGADEVIDYKKDTFDEKHKNTPFDVVVDMLGGAASALSLCC
jgi:NADPH:quinone reductase-like Zn-dependent oxidoreductase